MEHELLNRLHVCPQAREWAAKYPTLQAAWDACERGDWMLWFAGRLAGSPGSESRRWLLRCSMECAAMAKQYVREDQHDVVCAIARVECIVADYLDGSADLESLMAASAAAIAAASAASSTAYAASASASASSTAYAASTAASAAARMGALWDAAEIVRKWYPTVPELEE